MVTQLPTWKGYTVDRKLKEFRKVLWKKGKPSIEFVFFDSTVGKRLMNDMLKIRRLI